MGLTPTISVLELFVVLIGLLGLVVFILMIGLLWRDFRVLKENKQNGVDRRLVLGNMRNAIHCAFIVLIFVLLGLRGMFVPEPIAASTRTQSALIYWALLSVEIAAVLVILLDYVDRRSNMRDLKRRQLKQALLAAQQMRRHDDPGGGMGGSK